jgi:hypothetical protein
MTMLGDDIRDLERHLNPRARKLSACEEGENNESEKIALEKEVGMGEHGLDSLKRKCKTIAG